MSINISSISSFNLTKKHFKLFSHLLLIVSTCSFLSSSNKALANLLRPNMTTASGDLPISQSQCKTKAIEVSNFALVKYVTEEDNNVFRLRGRTSESRVMLVCMKKNQGVHFVVIASSDDGSQDEATTLVERVRKFMAS